MTLHTTYRLLRTAKACKGRYTVFRKAATALGYRGDNSPIPLTVALETNGLSDTLWALRATLPGEVEERDRIARLFACDCAEWVLPLFERIYPDDKRPRNAVEVARRFAVGAATDEELAAARVAVTAAWDAEGAAWVAEGAWQTNRLREYLEGRVE